LKRITKDDLVELRDMINNARWREKVFLAPDKKLSTSDIESFIKGKEQKSYWNYIIWEQEKRIGYIDFEVQDDKQGHTDRKSVV